MIDLSRLLDLSTDSIVESTAGEAAPEPLDSSAALFLIWFRALVVL